MFFKAFYFILLPFFLYVEITLLCFQLGLPWWLGGKESICQCRRLRFDPCARKMFWRRKWQLTPVFLPGKFHEQRSLAGYSPQGPKRNDLSTKQHFQFKHLWLGEAKRFVQSD